MARTDDDGTGRLDAILTEAAARGPEAPPELAARVLADARRFQPGPVRRSRRLRWHLADRVATLGGWPAVGGLAAAACAGFWIGISPPESGFDPGLFLMPEAELLEEAEMLFAFGWDVQEG